MHLKKQIKKICWFLINCTRWIIIIIRANNVAQFVKIFLGSEVDIVPIASLNVLFDSLQIDGESIQQIGLELYKPLTRFFTERN